MEICCFLRWRPPKICRIPGQLLQGRDHNARHLSGSPLSGVVNEPGAVLTEDCDRNETGRKKEIERNRRSGRRVLRCAKYVSYGNGVRCRLLPEHGRNYLSGRVETFFWFG